MLSALGRLSCSYPHDNKMTTVCMPSHMNKVLIYIHTYTHLPFFSLSIHLSPFFHLSIYYNTNLQPYCYYSFYTHFLPLFQGEEKKVPLYSPWEFHSRTNKLSEKIQRTQNREPWVLSGLDFHSLTKEESYRWTTATGSSLFHPDKVQSILWEKRPSHMKSISFL